MTGGDNENIQATQNRGRARQVGGEDAEAMLFIVEHPNPSILTTPRLGFASLTHPVRLRLPPLPRGEWLKKGFAGHPSPEGNLTSDSL